MKGNFLNSSEIIPSGKPYTPPPATALFYEKDLQLVQSHEVRQFEDEK